MVAVSNDLTLSSSLVKSVCLMHMNKMYAGRPGSRLTAIRGFKSEKKQFQAFQVQGSSSSAAEDIILLDVTVCC